MNQEELKKIKEEALSEHIPIIMDETLNMIQEIIGDKKLEKIYDRLSSFIPPGCRRQGGARFAETNAVPQRAGGAGRLAGADPAVPDGFRHGGAGDDPRP